MRVHEQGRIIPSLTRLIATTHRVRIYLVVVAPDAVTREQWNPALGDLVPVIGVAHGNASQGPVLPAADLRDGTLTGTVGFRQNPRRAPTGRIGGPLYEVGVVPDGVTRVVWQAATGEELDRAPDDRPHGGRQPRLRPGRHAAGAGCVRPLVRRGRPAHRDLRRGSAARRRPHPDRYGQPGDPVLRPLSLPRRPALLSGFAVFAVHGRTPVRTASGQTISQPRLSALPPGIVSSVDPRQPAQPEPDQVRELITRTGIRVWIVPGARGLCVAAVTPALLPGGFGAAPGKPAPRASPRRCARASASPPTGRARPRTTACCRGQSPR